jgi:hypothetical protein
MGIAVCMAAPSQLVWLSVPQQPDPPVQPVLVLKEYQTGAMLPVPTRTLSELLTSPCHAVVKFSTSYPASFSWSRACVWPTRSDWHGCKAGLAEEAEE